MSAQRYFLRFGVLLLCLALLLTSFPAAAQQETVTFRQWASSASATSQYGEGDWSARQATGAPNVNMCGNSVFAWASLTRTGQDSLTLLYDIPVIPTEVTVYQTYNPGAITGIDLILADGSGTITVADSADPGTPCPGRLILRIPEGTPPVNGVVIHLDQTITGDWNEIDAVKLLGIPLE